MKKELRRQQILKRKNFLPSLVLAIILWLLLVGVIYFVDPFSFGVIPLFFGLVFLSLLFTSSLLLGNTRRGVIISLSLSLFLVLRYLGIGHILNFLLLSGLAIVVEMLYSRK